MLTIPFGDTKTYGDVAALLNAPAQAVGQACGQNPIAVVIPCHRIMGTNWLGGYSSELGLRAKRYLLDLDLVRTVVVRNRSLDDPIRWLLAEWRLDSPHVQAVIEGRAKNSLVVEEVIQVPATIYDWKASEAERERAANAKSSPAAPAANEDLSEATDPPMPPASFEMLLTTLATEALMALGQVPHPITGQVEVKRNQAKFLIDTVDVLRQKTAGNLSNTEQQVIDSLLHQMRLVFVQTADAPAK